MSSWHRAAHIEDIRQAAASSPQVASASPAPSTVPADYSSVHDHAFDVLSNASTVDDDQRANAWEHFHSARDSKDLMQRLNTVDAPPEVKSALVTAKQISDPVPTATDKVVEAIHKLAALDPRTLEIAESHPAVLKSMLAGSNL